MSSLEGDEPSHELVMPFVAVTSRGGPFDDAAYTAGYEMGLLDAALQAAAGPIVERTVREENREQADLLAMRHGWTIECSAPQDGWTFAVFRAVR